MAKKIGFKSFLTLFITIIVIAISVSWFFIDSEDIQSVIAANYSMGLFIYVIYVVSSVVFVTFPIFPLFPFILTAYGLSAAIIFTFIGVNIGAYIAFYVSRKLGREFVIEKIGKKDYDKYEKITSISGFFHFLFLRLIANNYFDIVSYIGGLSKISHKDFITSTLFSSLVWLTITFSILENSAQQGKESVLFTLSMIYAVLGIIALVLVGKIFLKVRILKRTNP